jgi:hypothetical protein
MCMPHILVLDGVYTRNLSSGQLQFHALPELSVDDVHDIAKRSADRIDALLRNSGRFVDPEHAGAEAVQRLFAEQPVLGSCYQAASAGLALMGERAGQPSLRWMHPGAARAAARSPALCAEVRGANVHATAAVSDLERFPTQVIDRHRDPQIGTLLECALPHLRPGRFLRVGCATGREFVLSVPREMATAQQANAWTYGLEGSEIELEART